MSASPINTYGTWNLTAAEQELLGVEPGDRLGPGIVGDPARQQRSPGNAIIDSATVIADALLGAEEILEILHLRGTRGVGRECDTTRIQDVWHKVRAAKLRLATFLHDAS